MLSAFIAPHVGFYSALVLDSDDKLVPDTLNVLGACTIELEVESLDKR